MSRLYLPARIHRQDAERFFLRKRFGNLFGLIQHRAVKYSEEGAPTSLERVWMPAYAFRFTLTKGKTVGNAWIAVDASFGGFALFERQNELVEVGAPAEACFPPMLTPEEAEKRARQGLVRFILRKRGVKPSVQDIQEMIAYHHPVWVFYYFRRGKKIDLMLQDGYTGSPMGGQMRIAVVNALIRARKGGRSSDSAQEELSASLPEA